jgi:hypothetical protein
MHPISNSCTFLLACALALPAGAHADQADPGSGTLLERAVPPRAQLPVLAPAPQADAPFGDAATDELLDSARGGSDRTTIDTTLNGSVSANSATNVATGSNIIEGGSFAGMVGIPIVVQNTGANVLIQNATVINLQLK